MDLFEDVPCWEESFETGDLGQRWDFDLGTGVNGWGNKELQHYTADNITVRDRKAVINCTYTEGAYRSSRVKSKQTFLYGRVEFCAKLCSGKGLWQALWMLPPSHSAWPLCGEIDVMEHVGYDPNKIVLTHHSKRQNHKEGTSSSVSVRVDGATTEFHTYRVDWTPNSITWYIDNRRVRECLNEHSGREQWPFDQSYQLIMNVAVGGSWGGRKGIDQTLFGEAVEAMAVKYVRVYDWIRPHPEAAAHMALCRQVLERYDIEGQFIITDVISADRLNSSASMKFIVKLKTGESLFVGSVSQSWPSKKRVELALSAVSRAAVLFAGGIEIQHETLPVSRVSTPGILATGDKSLLVDLGPHRYYITSAIPNAKPAELSPALIGEASRLRLSMAAALGCFHRMMARPPRANGENATALSELTLSCRSSAYNALESFGKVLSGSHPFTSHRDFDAAIDVPLIESICEKLRWLEHNRCALVDALPAQWVHNDFQPKNVLVQDVSSSMYVVDLTDMVVASRCYDFYFLLTGMSDEAPAGFDFSMGFPVISEALMKNIFLCYFQSNLITFSTDGEGSELMLLTNCMQLKASSVAHYFTEWNTNPVAFRVHARWFLYLHTHRSTIRLAARTAIDEFNCCGSRGLLW